METGYDILFFWVTRMMMMGLKFMGEVPFRRVLLHGMVVDETGEKMGKLRGNTLDPLDLIHGASFESVVQKALPEAPVEEALAKFKRAYPSTSQMGKGFSPCGADALRFTLASYSPQARRIALSPGRIDGYRRFCNKIYNAVRFALPYLSDQSLDGRPPERPALLINSWILSRLGTAVEASTQGIEGFRLDDGSGALYHFFWDELCDWYIEMAKSVFQSGTEDERAETRHTLAHTLETALRALHPYMPFITEELWQRLPRPASRPASIALAPYPGRADGPHHAAAEEAMQIVQTAVSAARSVRSEHDIHPGAKVPLELRSPDPDTRELLSRQAANIELLVGTEGALRVHAPGGGRPPGTVVAVGGDVEVLVGLRGLVEPEKERERIERQLKKIGKDIDVLDKRLSNPNFASNAPGEVVAEARQQLASLRSKKSRLEEARELLAEL
jgi:valyl-tRNA synthetase